MFNIRKRRLASHGLISSTVLLALAAPVSAGLRGDANNSGAVDWVDAVAINNWFQFSTPLACHNAGDANADGLVDISDVIYINNWYWQNTPPVPYHIINCTGVEFPNDQTGPIVQQGTPGSVSQHTLIVTHATKLYDTCRHAKHAMDDLLTRFAAASKPIVYVLDYNYTTEPQQTQAAANWFPKSRNPNIAFYSSQGSYTNATLQVDSSTVTVVGGLALECYRRSVLAAIKSYYATRSSGTMTVNIPMDGVYTSNNYDSYTWPLLLHSYQKAQAGESPWANELNYLEIQWYTNWGYPDNPGTVFGSFACDPPGGLSMSQYRVETYVNNVQKTTLAWGTGPRLVRFKFWTSSTSVVP